MLAPDLTDAAMLEGEGGRRATREEFERAFEDLPTGPACHRGSAWAASPAGEPGYLFSGGVGDGGGGVDPPRPSWIPMLIGRGLISSGGVGLGAMVVLILPECVQPQEGLKNHEDSQRGEQDRHDLHPTGVLFA